MRIHRDPNGGDGNGNTFLTTLPPELQKEPSLATFKDHATLAKSYVEAQKLIGAKRVAIPGEKAADAEWEAFFNAAGRPETADKYETVELKDEKGQVVFKPDEKELTGLKQFFHKMGLTTRQAKQMQEYSLKYVHGASQQKEAERATAHEAGISTLKGEWGDKFEANVETARAVVKKFGDENVTKFLDDSGLGSNAPLVKFLNKIGEAILEDTGRRGTENMLPLNDATRAVHEIDALKIDAEFQKALGSPQHPGHQAAVQRWMRLFAVAHPGQQEG